MGRVVVIGSGGLLGEIIEAELARYGPVCSRRNIQALISSSSQPPTVIAVWASASEIGRIRRELRRTLPPGVDPLVVVLSQADPFIYFTRVRALHVDRRRLGLTELLDEIAGRVSAGSTTNAPVRAGLV